MGLEQFLFGGHTSAAKHDTWLWSLCGQNEEVPRLVEDSVFLVVDIEQNDKHTVFAHGLGQGFFVFERVVAHHPTVGRYEPAQFFHVDGLRDLALNHPLHLLHFECPECCHQVFELPSRPDAAW